jgi:HD-like signal output (HDOD) protein
MHGVKSQDAAALDAVVRDIHEISTLPHIAIRVMEVANDPNSGAVDLKEVMESDPALSARVLRVVNSSAYGLRERVTNLQYAIAYLGIKQIRNLAVTAAVSEVFHDDEPIGSYSRSGLWRHLVSVGICARLIGLRLSFGNFEDMFLAGLLHDVGIVLEDQCLHPRFAEMMAGLDDRAPLCAVEREHFGFDHAQLGHRIGQDWHFPPTVQAAIRHHHAAAGYRGEHVQVVRCVEVANLLCTLKGISSVGRKLVAFSRPTLEALSLGRDDVQVLAEALDRELAANARLFEI